MQLVVIIFLIFILLVVNELWWRKHDMHSEFSRKFVHIIVGSLVAFWPFFLSWDQIKLLSLAFLLVIGVSRYFNLFKAIHSAQRPTWGEVYFALSVGIVAFITADKWIYMAALLQMSLADGMAAIVGTTIGKKSRYTVFGRTKSIAGTLAFFLVSVIILTGYSHYSGTNLSAVYIVALSLAATLIENLGEKGIDNLLVPLLVAFVLANR